VIQRTAALALVVAAAVSCLESLPPAEECEAPARVIDGTCVPCDEPLVFVGDECRSCPAPPQIEYQNCQPVVSEVTGDGCLGDVEDAFSCLTGGPPEDCSCDAEDCAEPHACYDDACPPEVLAVAPDAACLSLGEERLSWFVQPGLNVESDPEGCLCGCVRCALQCDGRGLVLGAFEDNVAPVTRALQGLLVDLEGLMPPNGTVGFYVRARGWTTLAILVSSEQPRLEDARAGCFLPIVNDFSESVAYGPANQCVNIDPPDLPQPYEWQAEAEAPRWAMLPITFADAGASASILEIDCIIPFYASGS
jgi:hypothetical protein